MARRILAIIWLNEMASDLALTYNLSCTASFHDDGLDRHFESATRDAFCPDCATKAQEEGVAGRISTSVSALMRGVISEWDAGAGRGIIISDNGELYYFTREDLRDEVDPQTAFARSDAVVFVGSGDGQIHPSQLVRASRVAPHAKRYTDLSHLNPEFWQGKLESAN